MRKLFLSLLAVVCLALPGHGQNPEWAVIRIPSHGASATVIHTANGESWILGCAHAYEGADRSKPMAFDMPTPAAGPAQKLKSQLVAVDYKLDLSLVRIEAGPLPYVCKVANPGARLCGKALSAGYDEMQWPATVRPATLLSVQGTTQFTRERPWHGRSGGALIDADLGQLIGVVQGYSGPRASDARGQSSGTKRNFAEVARGGEGMYVSHAAILGFMRSAGFRFDADDQAPKVDPFRNLGPGQAPVAPRQPLPSAPPGRVPQNCPS